MIKMKKNLLILLSVISLVVTGCKAGDSGLISNANKIETQAGEEAGSAVDIKKVPKYLHSQKKTRKELKNTVSWTSMADVE